MPSSALRRFTQAFASPNSIKNATSTIPAYLVPAAVSNLPRTSGSTKKYPSRVDRRHASVTASADISSKRTYRFSNKRHDLPTEAEDVASSTRRRRDSSAWANIVESYLPVHLRLKDQPHLVPNNEPRRTLSIDSFHAVMAKARTYAKVDLLSYLGVYQNRWEAVIWLVKAMLEQHGRHAAVGNASKRLPAMLWPTQDNSLDAITGGAIVPVLPQSRKLLGGHFISRSDIYGEQGYDTQLGREVLGQIWQSLGVMILQAADRAPEDPSYITIMSHVFRILAHLHRIEAFPNSIYNYEPAADPTVLRRPPTLYFLSRRIMSTLSDLEWGLQWDEEIEKYSKLGYEVPKAVLQPKIREFGPELWLDLVLWACVEGGWVTEGAWIVGEMEKRKNRIEMQWSVISWQEICAVKSPQPGWLSMLKLEIEKTRMNNIAGFGVATGIAFRVEMGSRTISREVVLALVDGLVNTKSAHERKRGSLASILPPNLTACQDLLERGQARLSSNFLNGIIGQIIENANQETPGDLRKLLSWRLRHLHAISIDAGTSVSAKDYNTDDTAPILGLLHKILHGLAREGNAQASLGTLITIQNFLDEKRSSYIHDFADELRERLKLGEDTVDTAFDDENDLPALHPLIPAHVMAALLDVIIQHKFFGLGQWLLHNEDIDGGLFNSELFSNPNLHPALLRFATATADDKLLTDVLQQLETPLSEPVLHALLRCQVALARWCAVEELLRHLQRTPDMSWKASDAMAIARAILQMENNGNGRGAEQISQAQELLQNIVRGLYNSDRDPSQLPDFTETRTADQLGKIFQTLPGSLSAITSTLTDAGSRAHGSVNITPNAFNIILETVVEYYGSITGRRLWERWCLEPGESIRRRYRQDLDTEYERNGEKVVVPTLYMLRTVLRPIIAKRKTMNNASAQTDPEALETENEDFANAVEPAGGISERKVDDQVDEVERSVLDWGIRIYEKFGLTKKEIDAEMPGLSEKQKAAGRNLVNSPIRLVSHIASI